MKNVLITGMAFMLLLSCESKKDELTESTYFPLKVGDYWIYEFVDIDSLGNETRNARLDSVVVTNDTIINDERYFVFEGLKFSTGEPRGIIDILRDSSGFLVNHEGMIKFSKNNFTDVLTTKVYMNGTDTIGSTSYMMQEQEETISVPAGEFDALNFKGTVISDHPILGVKNPRYLDNYYAKGVGKILSSYFYFHSPVISERRLIRYHLK